MVGWLMMIGKLLAIVMLEIHYGGTLPSTERLHRQRSRDLNTRTKSISPELRLCHDVTLVRRLFMVGKFALCQTLTSHTLG